MRADVLLGGQHDPWMLSAGMSPWSATAFSVASGIVFTTSGATSPVTYLVSS